MKKLFKPTRLLWLFALCLVFSGCSNETLQEQQETLSQSLNAENSKEKKAKLHFNTSLKGDNEVPSRETNAAGEAIITISKDESYIHFKLIVANIEDVSGSHFHIAPAGSNGGVVAFLYSNPQASGPENGVLAEGYIMSEDLIGSLSGAELSDLISAIREGNVYVNVHTSAYPGGELRGQL